jgi:hypothetical protein
MVYPPSAIMVPGGVRFGLRNVHIRVLECAIRIPYNNYISIDNI